MRSLDINEVVARVPLGAVVPTRTSEKLERPLELLMGPRASRRLLDRAGMVGATRMGARDLAAVAEVPLRVAERVVAAREFGEAMTAHTERKLACSAEVVKKLPAGFARSESEVVLGLALTNRLTVKATIVFAKGGDVGATLHMRDVFTPLVRLGATAFILAHCHPSGDPTPSREDVEITNKLAQAGLILGIELLDHLVVATRGVVSFFEAGLMPTDREIAAMNSGALS